MPISFFEEALSFKLEDEAHTCAWLEHLADLHEVTIEELSYIFTTDDYLLDVNKSYLNHDYFTDIITFDNSDSEETIEGDIFISIDRVKENALNEGQSFKQELHRVMAHGLLHLLGYNDKSKEEKAVMTEKEDWALSLLLKRST